MTLTTTLIVRLEAPGLPFSMASLVVWSYRTVPSAVSQAESLSSPSPTTQLIDSPAVQRFEVKNYIAL